MTFGIEAKMKMPYYLKLFKCENGHKFEYQNTD